MIVSKTAPARCPTCGSTKLRQDDDVLDTWFSSWLWPFSTLGWPENTKDLAYFYPTNTLVTAQEIIFFWVARMIMAGYFCMKKPPFTKVYIHGTVRDITGKKMSKSLGNIIDPLEIIKQYGTDALRYTLVTATAIGQDVFLSEERFTAGRNFANKLWNATRYALSYAASSKPGEPSLADRWILSRLQRTITETTNALDAFEFNAAASTLYAFLWHDVCDWYVELSKHVEPSQRAAARRTLLTVLEAAMRLLHPVMPFVTEELWQRLRDVPSSEFRVPGSRLTRNTKRGTRNSVMVAPWPRTDKKLLDRAAEKTMQRLQAIIGGIRNTRATLNLPPGSRPRLSVIVPHAKDRGFFIEHGTFLQRLAGVGEVDVRSSRNGIAGAAKLVVDGTELFLSYEGLIDVAKEQGRVEQKIAELDQHITRQTAQLKNPQFADRAPADVVQQLRDSLAKLQEERAKLAEHLATLRAG